MMEPLFIDYPEECIVFFKRNMKFSLVSGSVLISLQVKGLITANRMWLTKTKWDKVLWFWAATRLCMYFLQLPIRWRLACKVWDAHLQINRAGQTQKLLMMLRTWEWTFIQYLSRALLAWLTITILTTYFYPELFRDHIHRQGILQYSLMSVLLLCVQTLISIVWLKQVLNQGWVDNSAITLEEFRNCTDRFRSLQELTHKLTSRESPFDKLPIAINPQTREEDPMKNVQIYFMTHCGICKSSFSQSPSPPVEGVPNSEPLHDLTLRNDYTETFF